MKTVKLTISSIGETHEEAIENLRFDLHEMLRRTGDGGEANLEDYIEKIDDNPLNTIMDNALGDESDEIKSG